ncbi:AhpD family alkylhydroperoxidase [Motilibacter rhizosphaerae]|uniref:AhpD family alkylhydroperoxidase n=1 Tax=Motilibacter rhizosphaerae TaxID=598652 RepID=A0A4Q7NUI2_9ACTN|nr:carboxymuconolactone decarboxylase family protein [Motilibacter rhizosphaerae]RZS90851.1 AhpD family alkylhydroperoxidase [Motilibacter rhizosphaerae]
MPATLTHQRLEVSQIAPEAYRGFLAVEAYLAASPLPKPVRELVKLRASQLNGCTYCVVLHARDARKDGETEDRLASVAAWREAPWFSEQERAALAYTEAATVLAPGGVSDEVWDAAAAVFDQDQLTALVVAAAMINLWNRIAVPTRKEPVLSR